MITKFQISVDTAGLTVYAVIRDGNGDIWDGADFVTFVSGDWGDYDVPMTEQGATGYYEVTIPAALPSGRYHVTFHNQAGASPAQTDDALGDQTISWDGAAVVDDLVIGSSVADICNLALSHLGVGKEIANLETEDSEEAETCRRFYETVRDQTLQDFAWPFATRIQALALVEEDPTDQWDYSYRYPANALRIRKIISVNRNDNRDSKIPYRILGDSSGSLIYTDEEDAEIEYTARVTNPVRYPPDFTMALSFRLAAAIAPRLTAGDPFKLGNRSLELYYLEIRKAQASAANEEAADIPIEAESIRSRE